MFKNQVIGTFLKDQYKQQVVESINMTGFNDRVYKHKLEALKENVLILRDSYIAHGLLVKQNEDEESGVDIRDIKELVEKGCQLFQAISFEPRDFYSWIEGDGYDFSKEFAYTHISTELFIKYVMLSSTHITQIDCQYNEYSTAEEVAKVKSILKDINEEKSNI